MYFPGGGVVVLEQESGEAVPTEGSGEPEPQEGSEPTEPTPVPQPEAEETAPQDTKTIEELAREVIRGLWGNGKERKRRLTAAGYDYCAVQQRVNEMLL